MASIQDIKNEIISYVLGWLADYKPDSALVYRATDYSLSNSSWDYLSFDGVVSNPYGIFSTSEPTKLICKSSGLYLVSGNTCFASNSTGIRGCVLKKNGTTYIPGSLPAATNGADTHLNASALIQMNPNDFIQLGIYQNSGSALVVRGGTNNAAQFGMVKVG